MKTFVIENTWLTGVDRGWGNGYVALTKESPFYGVSYQQLEGEFGVYAHGGITFSEYAKDCNFKGKTFHSTDDLWIIGFDTAHLYDTLEKWPKEEVKKETERFAKEVKRAEIMYKGSPKLKIMKAIENFRGGTSEYDYADVFKLLLTEYFSSDEVEKMANYINKI